MRIAYICADSGVPVFGTKGCSVHVLEVIRAFRRLGAEVELFALRRGGETPSDLKDLVVHKLTELRKSMSAAERERTLYELNGSVLGELRRACPFDLVYERYSLWSTAGMEFAREAGIPGVLEVNSPLIEEQAEHRTLTNRELAEQIRFKTFSGADTIVAVSEVMALHIREIVGRRSTIRVIPNGVDPTRFSNRRPGTGSNPDTVTVGFVGTFKAWHGIGYLIDAFRLGYSRNEQWRLLMVGDGPERKHLEDALDRAGIRHAVHFTGSVTPDEIPGWLSRMDVVVAPYPENVNFYFSPLKIYEYMAAAKPVIASRVGQIEELIDDGVNGLLVTPGDASAIADAVERLVEDQELRHSLGIEARRTVRKSHTWDSVARKIIELVRPARSSSYQPALGIKTEVAA